MWKTGLTVALLVLFGCRQNEVCAPGSSDSGVIDAGSQARCETQAMSVTVHPWASIQSSDMGKNLRNVRGFRGRLYFGYGDLNQNTGPIVIASYEPMTDVWANHLTLQTESVERFVEIGNELWAPCSDAHGPANTGCEYGKGDSTHNWTTGEFDQTIHVMDAVERVPGEVLIGGSTPLRRRHGAVRRDGLELDRRRAVHARLPRACCLG